MNAQQLRNSILQQAIQGKLVAQDPNDEPASVLLQRIRKEKERLVKEGKLKKKDLESKPIEEGEIPFEIPEGWEWCRISSIASVLGGKRIPAGRKLSQENTGHVYIRVSDMKENTVSTDNLQYVPEDIYPSISRYIINKEDVYITVAGTIGRIGKIPSELDGVNLTENADRLVFSVIDQDWLIKCLQSNTVQTQIVDVTTKVGQPKLAIARIQNLLIPLPPLAEQRRIVAKIEELMPLVERYGKAQQALDQLNESLPARLRQSILQEAIFGNHVGIQLSEIKDVKLKDICEIVMGQSPEGNTYNNSNGIEFHQGKVAFGEMFLKPSGVFTTNPTKYAEPDSIVVSVRAPVGTANITKRKICIGRGLACIKPKQDADLMYIYYLLESPEVREYLEDNSTGTTVKAISGKVLQNLEIPLPPLSEQKRIVAKVEELFGVLG